jgi:tRNA (cytidine32/uridine32-2'-O)-methyltransferase
MSGVIPIASFKDRVRVVLIKPLRCGNVGSAARAMKNMGLSRLYLVNPQEDRWDLAQRMAPGAHDVLDAAVHCDSAAEAVADCHCVVGTTARGRRYRWPVQEPAELARDILATPGEIALLFGPEDSGLDNDDLLLCHKLVTIATDEAPSLNLSQAVLILAHHIFEEARRQGYTPPPRQRKSRRGERDVPAAPCPMPLDDAAEQPAPVELTQAAARAGVQVLARTAYLTGRSQDQVRLTLYHLLQRTDPCMREVSVLLGMMRKVRYTLDHPEARVDPTSVLTPAASDED